MFQNLCKELKEPITLSIKAMMMFTDTEVEHFKSNIVRYTMGDMKTLARQVKEMRSMIDKRLKVSISRMLINRALEMKDKILVIQEVETGEDAIDRVIHQDVFC